MPVLGQPLCRFLVVLKNRQQSLSTKGGRLCITANKEPCAPWELLCGNRWSPCAMMPAAIGRGL